MSVRKKEREAKLLEEEWNRGFAVGAKKLEDRFQHLLNEQRANLQTTIEVLQQELDREKHENLKLLDRIEQLKHTLVIYPDD